MEKAMAWPRAPQPRTSMRVKPAGSLVCSRDETSAARESPASKWVIPFCTGKPWLATFLRWKGRNTNLPKKSSDPVVMLITSGADSASHRVRAAPPLALIVFPSHAPQLLMLTASTFPAVLSPTCAFITGNPLAAIAAELDAVQVAMPSS
ncbi:hypothetical protein GOP47_0020430 [Adiantum capillus-veneris]|uniref:Uncharacterized protein n=1 Tax=Adiantum capillus-veneris TaxID=13818 RepID=A0A9D4UD91_ADICA|nr:hypothetical protein GOP47_0020430 [Adiantum capillus-veneris]